MVSFEIFVKAMLPSLLELKVLPSFCFAFKIPDDRAVTSIYVPGKAMHKMVEDFNSMETNFTQDPLKRISSSETTHTALVSSG